MIDHFTSGNKREFSIKVGISPTVIENVVGSRKGNPSFEVLNKILYAFENINPDWLLTGSGSMLRIQEEKTAPVSCSDASSDTSSAISSLKSEIKHLQELLAAKDKTIDACERTIKLLMERT